MEVKHIITAILVVFKIYIIVNFIIKYRKMVKKIAELEKENEKLKCYQNSTMNKSA